MILPIGDDNIVGGHKPVVSYMLIALNVAVYIFQITLEPTQIDFFLTDYGIIPAEISQGDDTFALITSMFLHGGLLHLLGNILFLWIFADNIEAIVGSSVFFMFYFFGGLFASMAHVISDTASIIPTVGASGAISAVMGGYLVMFPKSRIKILVFIKTFRISALYFLGFWFAQQLVSGMGLFPEIFGDQTNGVAWWAHIGGFVYGVILGWILKQRFGQMYSYGSV